MRFLKLYLICCSVTFFKIHNYAQIANYVSNGSFETLNSNSLTANFDVAKYWGPIDTTKNAYYLFTTSLPNLNAPYCSTGFQYPRKGHNFILTQFFCTTCKRGYPRNRLRATLKANVIYCAKYYVVSTNNSFVAIANYGMYFGDSSIDTITQCTSPIAYLTPQVENQNGIISDTLNWTAITGTFVATGNEKYLVLGNFRTNAATNTLVTGQTYALMSSDIYIDDVSVIELNLPAFAGNDTLCTPGNTIYIGRQRDVGIDEACTWYQLPNIQTAIDTAAGIWVSPITTSTYVVRQEICGNVKWDTVVVRENPVGLEKLIRLSEELKIYPVPATNLLTLEYTSPGFDKEFKKAKVLNNLGQLVLEADLNFNNKRSDIDVKELPIGIYSLQFQSVNMQTVSKRFIISR